MSDEQTRLLEQILEVERESLAFAKQQHEKFLELQQTALARQKKALVQSRIALAAMFAAIALLVLVVVLRRPNRAASNPRARIALPPASARA